MFSVWLFQIHNDDIVFLHRMGFFTLYHAIRFFTMNIYENYWQEKGQVY